MASEKRPVFRGCVITIFAAMVVVLVGMWVVASSPWGARYQDLPTPPDDLDLYVRTRDVPDEQNAYVHFMRAVEATRWRGAADELLVARVHNRQEWPAAEAASFLERNEEAWGHYERGLACTRSQAPALDPRDEAGGDPFGTYLAFRSLLYVQARSLEEGVSLDAALDAAAGMGRFGATLTDCRGLLVQYLTAEGIQHEAQGLLLELLYHGAPSAEATARLVPLLRDWHGTRDDGIADVFRREYEHTAEAYENMRDRGMFGATIIPPGMIFQQNRTHEAIATVFRAGIENVHVPYAEGAYGPEAQGWEPPGLPLIGGNTVGKSHVMKAFRVLSEANIRHALTRAEAGALLVIAALREETARTGEPIAGEAAAQHVLDARIGGLPADPFTGEAMRLLPEAGVVACAGTDLAFPETYGFEGLASGSPMNPAWRLPGGLFAVSGPQDRQPSG